MHRRLDVLVLLVLMHLLPLSLLAVIGMTVGFLIGWSGN